MKAFGVSKNDFHQACTTCYCGIGVKVSPNLTAISEVVSPHLAAISEVVSPHIEVINEIDAKGKLKPIIE